MSIELKNFLKIWLPTAAILCTLIGYGGNVLNTLNGYAKELHNNTLAINQMRQEMSEYKVNQQVNTAESKVHEQRQTDDIERLSIDVARLKTIARIAVKERDVMPVSDHCNVYHDALVFDEPKRTMTLN